MSRGHIVGVLTLLASIVLFAASRASDEVDETEKKTQARYSSPAAVFDAYREARIKRDWRKVFSLLTTEAQNDAVFESFFASAIHSTKEEQAIVKKYIDAAAAEAEYEKKFKEKHGIDIAEARKGHEIDATYKPPAPDRDLYVEAVAKHVEDKVGFFAAVCKLSGKNSVLPLGDLEQVTIKGDTAAGSAKMPTVPPVVESPRKPGQLPTAYDRPFKFRQINGGWLIDSL